MEPNGRVLVDDFAGADAEAGPEEEPLGRAEKVIHEVHGFVLTDTRLTTQRLTLKMLELCKNRKRCSKSRHRRIFR